MDKKLDITHIISILLAICAAIGWGITLEVRLAKIESYREMIDMQIKQAKEEREDNREFIEKLFGRNP